VHPSSSVKLGDYRSSTVRHVSIVTVLTPNWRESESLLFFPAIGAKTSRCDISLRLPEWPRRDSLSCPSDDSDIVSPMLQSGDFDAVSSQQFTGVAGQANKPSSLVTTDERSATWIV